MSFPTAETEPTRRFTNRVANYIAYRPKYPAAMLAFMRDELGLTPSSVVADVGSGTGILTEMLLRGGNIVYAIEPNAAMRAAAENLLREFPKLRSVDATAEATGLADSCVDFVTAGQAFHWFDAVAARREFKRILKPGGTVALVWNIRRLDTTPFLRDYEQLLRDYGTDYSQVNCEQLPEDHIARFFAGAFQSASFDNHQILDYESLRGRLLSSSYVPLEGHPQYELMLTALRRIFDLHERDGQVTIEYDTKIYYGHLA
jgi:SAM-dependent methyltransferase